MARPRKDPNAPVKELANNRKIIVLPLDIWEQFKSQNGAETIGNLPTAKAYTEKLAEQASDAGNENPAFVIIEEVGTMKNTVKRAVTRNFESFRIRTPRAPKTTEESTPEVPHKSRRH